jgi:hypothetical protein
MTAKTLEWFREWERLGYRLQRTRSGHLWAIGPAGDKVTVLGSTNSDHRSHLNERARLRQHQRAREARARNLKPSTEPESPRQVRDWEYAKHRYARAGLCERCAALAAWSHQDGAGGWAKLRPPCVDCAEIVEQFAYPTVNPLWRAVMRKRLPARKRPERPQSDGTASGVVPYPIAGSDHPQPGPQRAAIPPYRKGKSE